MKKFWIILSSIIAIIIITTIGCYIFASTFLGYVLSSSFGTKTTVNNTAITPRTLHFWQLHVKNPTHTKHPYALTIKRIAIRAPITTYFTNNIVIDAIKMDELTLIVETLPGEKKLTNWDSILNHINESNKSSKPSKRHATIKVLTIDNLTVKVIDRDGKIKTTKIKNLTFKDLNTKKGNITKQIAKTIIMKMIFNVKNLMLFPIQITNESFNNFFHSTEKGSKSKTN